MARQIHELNYTTEELDALLGKAENKPFIRYHDEVAGVYRFFNNEEDRDIWVKANADDEMTPEIEALQFTDPITAPAPYSININLLTDNKYVLEGSKGNILQFSFETRDSHEGIVKESVDVFYTFSSPSGEKKTSKVYNAGVDVELNIDDYLALGTNVITITVKGRATKASKTIVATYNVVTLSLDCNFPIYRPIDIDTTGGISVTYTIEGNYDKRVMFYIDGHLKYTTEVKSTERNKTENIKIEKDSSNDFLPGKHHLQVVAEMTINDYKFRSNLLYYEFIIIGSREELTTTLIQEVFPYTQEVFVGNIPGLTGEQYVSQKLTWAYYSSDVSKSNVTIQWRLFTEGGIETPLATRNADIVDTGTEKANEPLVFMPTEFGAYNLQALIDGEIIESYTISVIPNTSGIMETISNMTLKLTGLGRDNSEPANTLTSWESKGYKTTFRNQPWNANSGWNSNALWLNNGATANINIKPFAVEYNVQANDGAVIEVDFETFNIEEEGAEVFAIKGNSREASLIITGTKAVLKGSMGTEIEYRFKSDERVKLAFVIYPNSYSDYRQKMFLYANGIMSCVREYETAENFNIGSTGASSTDGTIKLGNADSQAGIKLYYIRTYNKFINMYEELNNYIIDSGKDISKVVLNNDVYTIGTKNLDVDKLEGTITTIKITGPLDELINRGSGKGEITAALNIVSPEDANINMSCALAAISNAGQSTLDKPVPSFHVKLGKNTANICYDRDGKVLPKNRYAFREGNVPEKKFRLQANYMDSSGCHNGAFFRMFNSVAPKVKIDNDNVLLTPAEKYALNEYPSAMQRAHGDDPTGNNWKFPYNMHMCPDSIACIVVWRPNEEEPYQFLGQYVMMEEKKANYANGMHSIYDGVDSTGKADPFGFKSNKSETRLWDNSNCHQVEFLRSTGDLELFLDDSTYDDKKEDSFELIYPDEDDLTPQEIQDEWDKFYNDIVHPITSSYNNKEVFHTLLYGSDPVLDRWHFAAYRCLALRNACTDSMVRNMELVTYDGHTWLPKWWDVDMECGMQQTGECNIEPTSDRDTVLSTGAYAFSGRIKVGGKLLSSWLWDGLEGDEQFIQDCKTMDAALYAAGWNYNQMTKMQDEEYINKWSESLYNESSISKYLKYNDLNALQGDRTPHRHWFLKTSYDYFDAVNVCGEYTSKTCSIRTQSIQAGTPVRFKASIKSYFGWGLTSINVETGVEVNKGVWHSFTIDRTPQNNDPLHIFPINKMEEIDLSNIGDCICGTDIDFERAYDPITGTPLKVLNIGISKEKLKQGIFNPYTSATTIQGLNSLTRLETLNIQGYQYFTTLNLENLSGIKNLYAAGTNIVTYKPASGTNIVNVELPTTVTSLDIDGCVIENNSIKWYETMYNDEGTPVNIREINHNDNLISISMKGTGDSEEAKNFVSKWAKAKSNIEDITKLELTNINWTRFDKEALLKIARIPESKRNITGYIECRGTLTGTEIAELKEAFGEYAFTTNTGIRLRLNAETGFVLSSPATLEAGNTYTVSGVAFPITEVQEVYSYKLGYIDSGFFIPYERMYDAEKQEYYYEYLTAKLYESSGELITEETNQEDFTITIQGSNVNVNAWSNTIIKRRVYPNEVNIQFIPPTGCTYDATNNRYLVSDRADYAFSIEEDPTVTGTVIDYSWECNIPNVTLRVEDKNTYQFTLNTVPDTPVDSYLKYTIKYKNNSILTDTIDFRLKKAVIVINNSNNEYLQDLMYTRGITSNSQSTTDLETAVVTDLSSLLRDYPNSDKIQHIVEINNFTGITELDLSTCTLLGVGTSADAISLYGDSYDIKYFPSKGRELTLELTSLNFTNTHFKGINLKPNYKIDEIIYPNTIEEIIIKGNSFTDDSSIVLNETPVLTKLHLENVTGLSQTKQLELISHLYEKEDVELYIDNVDWRMSYNDLVAFGNAIPKEKRVIKGTITLTSNVTRDNIIILSNLFGNNVFTYDNDFVITSNQTLVCAFSDKDTILSGESVQFTAVKLPVAEQTEEWEFVSPVEGIFIDENGLVTTYETNVAHTVQVKVRVNGVALTTSLSLTVNARTYPTSSIILGEGVIKNNDEYEYELSLTPEEFTGNINHDWYLLDIDTSNLKEIIEECIEKYPYLETQIKEYPELVFSLGDYGTTNILYAYEEAYINTLTYFNNSYRGYAKMGIRATGVSYAYSLRVWSANYFLLHTDDIGYVYYCTSSTSTQFPRNNDLLVDELELYYDKAVCNGTTYPVLTGGSGNSGNIIFLGHNQEAKATYLKQYNSDGSLHKWFVPFIRNNEHGMLNIAPGEDFNHFYTNANSQGHFIVKTIGEDPVIRTKVRENDILKIVSDQTQQSIKVISKIPITEEIIQDTIYCDTYRMFGEEKILVTKASFSPLITTKDIIMTPNSNPEVFKVLKANNMVDTDSYLLKETAATFTTLPSFKGNTGITSFNELQYFTSITSLANEHFRNCTNLKSIKIPEKVVTLGNCALAECTKLNYVEILNKETQINYGQLCFSGDTALKELTLYISYLQQYNFNGCTNLKDLTFIGATIINRYSTNGCSALKELYFPENSYIERYSLYAPNLETVVCADGTTFDSYAFQGGASLKTVTLPDTLTGVVGRLFDSSKVETVYLGKKATTIDQYCFVNAPNLKEIYFKYDDDGLCKFVTFGNYCFQNCPNLEHIGMLGEDRRGFYPPDSTRNMNTYSFSNTGFTNIEIPNNITLNAYTFYNSTKLTRVEFTPGGSQITLPNSIFRDCIELVYIDLGERIKIIDTHAFRGCSKLIQNAIKGVGIVSIINNDYAFAETGISEKLDLSVLFPNLSSLGNYTFANNPNLTSVVFSDTLKTVGSNVFYNTGITTLDTPKNVTALPDQFFRGMIHLEEVTLHNTSTNPNRTLNGLSSTSEFDDVPIRAFKLGPEIDNTYVEADGVIYNMYNQYSDLEKYSRSTEHFAANSDGSVSTLWNDSRNIVDYIKLDPEDRPPFIIVSYPDTYNITDRFVSLSKTESFTSANVIQISESADSEYSTVPVVAKTGKSSYKIRIPEECNYIGIYHNTTWQFSISVYIPSTKNMQLYAYPRVKQFTGIQNCYAIGPWAFAYAKYLDNINLPSTTKILDHAFRNSNITSFVGNNVETVGTYGFYGCSHLTEIDIPKSTAIGQYSFQACTALDNIVFNDDLLTVGSYAFDACTSLSNIVFPDTGIGHLTLASYAFNGCTKLTRLLFTSDIKSIGDLCFNGCTALTEVTFKNGVVDNLESLGHQAFKDTKLIELVLPEGLKKSLPGIDKTCPYGGTRQERQYPTTMKTITIPTTLESYGALSHWGSFSKVYWNGINTVTVNSIYDTGGYACSCRSYTKALQVTTDVEIIFGENVESIPPLFHSAPTQARITVLNPTPPTITTDTFGSVDVFEYIKVPAASIDDYKNAAVWTDYKDKIIAI